MAKGDYYFPLYYKRLLTSTIGWKDDEFGAYMRLLIHQFDNGSIPKDLEELKRIAPSIKKHWPLISKKFVDDGNGSLINHVMHEIYRDVQVKKSINSEKGKRGGRGKRKNRIESDGLPNGFQSESESKAIPITNNQQPIKRIEREHSTKIFDAESALLANQIEMERICMATGKSMNQAKDSLHKYHLHLQENEKYPRSRVSLFAGFEKWLINEKTATVQQTGEVNPLRKLIV